MSDQSNQSELETHLFFLCTQVVYRRNHLLQDALRPLEILPTEYRILSAVLRKGPLTMQELAQWTAYERTRVTRILHAMEARGWIARSTSAQDKRSVVVQMTESGREMFWQAKVIVDQVTDLAMSDNSEEEIAQLRHGLTVLRKKLIAMES
ncbi:MarR family transcriptional regulator [Herbaspirillum sp. meg3]|jgi:DNA-binding MarR family transcriptional regulator|uniref:MarR family winged helix-turn-helix transcriptional regulator n=1 Tax=Herbaspirillum sp. meg3 TaxID=2025949 RepID=UPI000B989293|nr:MarR family transcriptional regulator [Herbaspirillum sp. meg3]ASU39328.1 MarR family transcriptional regulator [Herbaspirillum sp. meg3]